MIWFAIPLCIYALYAMVAGIIACKVKSKINALIAPIMVTGMAMTIMIGLQEGETINLSSRAYYITIALETFVSIIMIFAQYGFLIYEKVIKATMCPGGICSLCCGCMTKQLVANARV